MLSKGLLNTVVALKGFCFQFFRLREKCRTDIVMPALLSKDGH